MKHSIRERIVDPIRGKLVKVSTINAELGSGILNKNGKEIFEGDKIKINVEAIQHNSEYGFEELDLQPPKDGVATTVYQYGEFVLMWDVDDRATWVSLSEFDLLKDRNRYLEIVGHVEDKQ